MTNFRTFNRGFHKMIQNYFVMKSNYLRSAKSTKCNNPKPRDQSSKCPGGKLSPEGTKTEFWKKISIFGAVPIVAVVSVCVFLGIVREGEKSRPEFVKYEYMRIRNKRFPWGDGNKTLFHNKQVNALPDGYED